MANIQNALVPAPLLTNLAVNFKNKNYIAEEIFKQVTVPQLFGQYTAFDTDVVFRPTDDMMGAFSSANQIDIKGTLANFVVDTHALKTYVDPKEIKQAGALPVRQYKVDALMNSMKLNLEILAATTLANSAIFTNGQTLTTGSSPATNIQFNDGVNSDPRGLVLSINEGATVNYNTAVMGRQVYNVLLQHPKIIEQIKYTRPGFEVADILAAYLGVERILVGEAKKLTNKKGQAQVLVDVWGKDVYLLNVPAGAPSATLANPAPGYLAISSANGALWRIYTGRHPDMGTAEGAELIKCESDYKILVSAPTMAYRITSAIA